jgi:hypothetical protein
MLTILPIVFLVVLIPSVLFFLSLHRALARCAPASRTMSPGQVWVGLIPLVSAVWPFFLVNAMSTSLHNEFVRRGMAEDPAPGQSIGMGFAILSLLCAVPLVNFVAFLPMVVCWILYWVKIEGFSSKLAVPFQAAA